MARDTGSLRRGARSAALTAAILGMLAGSPAALGQQEDVYIPPVGRPVVETVGAGTRFIIYVPPDLGAPSARVGGGTRGDDDATLEPLPHLEVLAPDHVAVTTEKQPTLYWFVSESTSHPVEFSIRKEGALEPLKEVRLLGLHRKGVHALSLKERGVSLELDADYRWFVSLVPDPGRRSNDVLASGMIRRRDPTPQLRQRLDQADEEERAFIYGESGIWYDALDLVSQRIDTAPKDRRLRALRASLLDQVGMSDVAAYDRSAAEKDAGDPADAWEQPGSTPSGKPLSSPEP
jgi:hypothetical protein